MKNTVSTGSGEQGDLPLQVIPAFRFLFAMGAIFGKGIIKKKKRFTNVTPKLSDHLHSGAFIVNV